MIQNTANAIKHLTQEIRFAFSPFLAELTFLATSSNLFKKFNEENPLVLPEGTLYFDIFNKDPKDKKYFIVWTSSDGTGLILERDAYSYYSKNNRNVIVHKFFRDVTSLKIKELSDLAPYEAVHFSSEISYQNSPSFKKLMSSLKKTSYSSGNRLLGYDAEKRKDSRGFDYNQEYPKELYVKDSLTLALVIDVLSKELKKEKIPFKDEQKTLANSLGRTLLNKEIKSTSPRPLLDVCQRLYNELYFQIEKAYIPVVQGVFKIIKKELIKTSKNKPADIRDRDGFAYLENGKIFLNYRDERLWAFSSTAKSFNGYRAYQEFSEKGVTEFKDKIHYFLRDSDWTDEGIVKDSKKPSWETFVKQKTLTSTIQLDGQKKNITDADIGNFFALIVDLDLLPTYLTDVEDPKNKYFELIQTAEKKMGQVVKQPNDIFKVLKYEDKPREKVELSQSTKNKIKKMLKL